MIGDWWYYNTKKKMKFLVNFFYRNVYGYLFVIKNKN